LKNITNITQWNIQKSKLNLRNIGYKIKGLDSLKPFPYRVLRNGTESGSLDAVALGEISGIAGGKEIRNFCQPAD